MCHRLEAPRRIFRCRTQTARRIRCRNTRANTWCLNGLIHECPFVKKHYGSDNMQNLQKEFTDKGVVWLTIDSNAPGTEGNLTPKRRKKSPTSWKTHETALLLDPEGNAGRAYGAKNTPNMVIINPDGKIVYHGAIDSKATPNPSDIPSSTNYVKAALDQSLAGKSVTTPETKPYGCSVKYKSS